MEENLSGTLAIDLGNTNTVVATTVLVFPKSIARVPDKFSSIRIFINQLSSFCDLSFENVE